LNKVLGLDFGKVRIGIALSDETRTFAFGKEYIQNNNSTLKYIKSIVDDENVTEIILGYPLTLKGGKSAQTLEVESFEEKLKGAIQNKSVKITRWDERFTSKIAEESLIESGMKKKKRQVKGNIDIVSAALLLQSYLDSIKDR